MYSEQKYGAITKNFKHAINENLGKYTSYGVGGNCDVMFFPENLSQFKRFGQRRRFSRNSHKHFFTK